MLLSLPLKSSAQAVVMKSCIWALHSHSTPVPFPKVCSQTLALAIGNFWGQLPIRCTNLAALRYITQVEFLCLSWIWNSLVIRNSVIGLSKKVLGAPLLFLTPHLCWPSVPASWLLVAACSKFWSHHLSHFQEHLEFLKWFLVLYPPAFPTSDWDKATLWESVSSKTWPYLSSVVHVPVLLVPVLVKEPVLSGAARGWAGILGTGPHVLIRSYLMGQKWVFFT